VWVGVGQTKNLSVRPLVFFLNANAPPCPLRRPGGGAGIGTPPPRPPPPPPGSPPHGVGWGGGEGLTIGRGRGITEKYLTGTSRGDRWAPGRYVVGGVAGLVTLAAALVGATYYNSRRRLRDNSSAPPRWPLHPKTPLLLLSPNRPSTLRANSCGPKFYSTPSSPSQEPKACSLIWDLCTKNRPRGVDPPFPPSRCRCSNSPRRTVLSGA